MIHNINEDVIINTANIEKINATAIEDKNITEGKCLFWLKQILSLRQISKSNITKFKKILKKDKLGP